MSDRPPEEPRPVTPEKARQGHRGWPVLLVLVAGLGLAMIIWGFVEIYGWTIRPAQEEQVGDPATVEEGATGGITLPRQADQ